MAIPVRLRVPQFGEINLRKGQRSWREFLTVPFDILLALFEQFVQLLLSQSGGDRDFIASRLCSFIPTRCFRCRVGSAEFNILLIAATFLVIFKCSINCNAETTTAN